MVKWLARLEGNHFTSRLSHLWLSFGLVAARTAGTEKR
jgi:hypothetical protein